MQGLMIEDYPLTLTSPLERVTTDFQHKRIHTESADGYHPHAYEDLGEELRAQVGDYEFAEGVGT